MSARICRYRFLAPRSRFVLTYNVLKTRLRLNDLRLSDGLSDANTMVHVFPMDLRAF